MLPSHGGGNSIEFISLISSIQEPNTSDVSELVALADEGVTLNTPCNSLQTDSKSSGITYCAPFSLSPPSP